MSRDDVVDLLGEDGAVFLEGPEFDKAIVGVCDRFGAPRIVCYDYNKVIRVLQKQGMTEEDAEEWFDYNIIGAWMGDTTPVFLHRITPRRASASLQPVRHAQSVPSEDE